MPSRGRPPLAKGPVANLAGKRSTLTRSATRSASQNNTRPSKKPRYSVKDSEDEDDSMDELSPAKPASKASSRAKSALNIQEPQSRASLSSVSTIRDSVESSLYSTPGTSDVGTPAANDIVMNKISVTVPKASPTLVDGLDMAANAALDAELAVKAKARSERLKALNERRNRNQVEDEDEKAEKEYEASRQLAMSLQQEEYAKSNKIQQALYSSPRNSSRPLRPVMTKHSYVLDSADEDEDLPLASSRPRNGVVVMDSDDEDDDIYSSDSDESLNIVLSRKMLNSSLAKSGKGTASAPSQQHGRLDTAKFPISGRGRGRPPKNQVSLPMPAVSASSATGLPRAESSISALTQFDDYESSSDSDDGHASQPSTARRRTRRDASYYAMDPSEIRALKARERLEAHHPELLTMWKDLETLITIPKAKAQQPPAITRELKPFQLEGLNWMQEMEKTQWGGGLLGDEMGMGKTIQAVSLIMSDYPAKNPSLVLIPPVALMQWQQEMGDYTNHTLKTFVYHGTNKEVKNLTLKELKKYDVILMSYNSLESMHRKQERGGTKNGKIYKVKSVMHQIRFHRVILDEAHCIKSRQSNTAKACFALTADHKWCLSGTPLQNRIGELFSLIRFLDIRPFACYFCKQCPCSKLEWDMGDDHKCKVCHHGAMSHLSVFNQELLNPIVKYGNSGKGKEAFEKLRLLTDRFMLRRIKRNESSAMELPAKEIFVDRHFFGEEENDFASSIMKQTTRKFETYVAEGVLLNNYANIFGLIMQMRQVADHPDLILKRDAEGGRNMLVCCICDEIAEDPVRSLCKHDFCRDCVNGYIKTIKDNSSEEPDCPRCHIGLSIDLEQAAVEQEASLIKKNSIINRIKMENWTSSSKIEALVYDLHELRSRNSSCKSIIFSQFTSMLQLVEWRLHRAGISTVMLDGTMTPAQRQASINHFMTDVDVECFLVSLKAGGVALNLTEASKVFIIDPWWNPAAEWQSADRCHRIGQTRPCSITRLCIEDSVEARMVLLQEKKANMINSTINNDSAAMESLTPEDMQFLFRGS